MKTFVEHCQKLNVRDLTRQTKNQMFEALLNANILVSEQGIKFTITACHFGGQRYWLLCPNCNKRVGTLYKKPMGDLLLCRKCQNLSYLKTRYHKMI